MGPVNLDALVDVVARMREAQRTYFKAPRDSLEKRQALVASKEAERQVDELVRVHREAQAAQQGKLFG